LRHIFRLLDRDEDPEKKDGPQPEHAWKALSLTNDWIRHADTKTGVTLAFIGATATVLFNLIKDECRWTGLLVTATGLCVSALCLATMFAGLALFPRVKVQPTSSDDTDEDAVNLLFFGDIAGHYAQDRPTYTEVLTLLTSDPARVTKYIAGQIHENAHIATTKFKHVNRAILVELFAVVAVAFVALARASSW